MLGIAVALTILFNIILLQRRFRPLERLVDQMERVDLSKPGANLRLVDEEPPGPEEVTRLHHAFVRMLERLEAERRRASSAALNAQEEERARVARDLHDEVNQALTGLLLRLEAAREKAPPELAPSSPRSARSPIRRCRSCSRLARQLRPTALDDLGLRAALAGHVRELERQGVVEAGFEVDGDARRAARPMSSSSSTASPRRRSRTPSAMPTPSTSTSALAARRRRSPSRSPTTGADSPSITSARGLGLGGMRERALLVGGDLQVESRPGEGTRVQLNVPIENGDDPRPWKLRRCAS